MDLEKEMLTKHEAMLEICESDNSDCDSCSCEDYCSCDDTWSCSAEGGEGTYEC